MRLFKQLKWFFYREWRHYIGAIIILFLIALLQLIPPIMVGNIVDTVLLKSYNRLHIIYIIIIMIIIAVIAYWLRYAWRILLFGSAYKLAVELRNKLYYLLSNQSPEFYYNYRTGDLIARATNDVDRVVFAAGEGVLTLVDSLVIGCSVIFIMVLKIDWKLTILSLAPMPIMAFIINNDGKKLHQYFRLAQASFSLLNSRVQEDLTNIRMIKIFGIEQRQLQYFTDIAIDTSKKNMDVALIDSRFDPIIYLTIGLSNLLAVFGGSWLVINKQMTLGQLTSFIMYLGLMIWPMLALAWMFNIVERGSAAYTRINQMLNESYKITDGKFNLPNYQGDIILKIKEFSYPKTNKIVLSNINYIIKAGSIIGICGPTGSGKSTLLALILRNFDLEHGKILYHNIPLYSLILNEWRNKLSVVNQNNFLFSDSIINNITLGRPNISFNDIKKVTNIACIHQEIISLPNGYYTKVGERGMMLSGGQKQRIAIARSLLSDSADILILDDALSAVDTETENQILNNINKWKRNKTLIIISHKLNSIKYADHILVFNNGSIIEQGTHSFLLKQSKWYKKIYHYQQLKVTLK
ncbi:MAG: SmdA family multidrug ABC transporter permease/ATP-binding protein [Candidatus Lightella neohaematopini]|nr:SmdA family multidrug ABC transporter permease/ATP-binding protein [Candidatus Lightella neohaematopini]